MVRGAEAGRRPPAAITRSSSEPSVEVALLRHVDLLVGGRPAALGPPKQRAVFAALAVHPNRRVPVQTLIERVWDEPPAAARSSVYAHVARLRRVLRGVGVPTLVDVVAEAGGYTLAVEPDRTDLHRYHQWTSRADATTDPASSAALYARAISLWSGEPLAGIAGAWAARMRTSLRNRHLAVLVRWAECELSCHRATAVVDALYTAVHDYPLAESLLAVLLRALAMDGRSAEALDLYARHRELFLERLGTEPGHRLAAVHTAILRNELPVAPFEELVTVSAAWAGGDAGGEPSPGVRGTRPVPRLAVVGSMAGSAAIPPAAVASATPSGSARNGSSTGPAANGGPPGRTSEATPRQLPPDVPGFTGRDAELDFLNEVLDGCADPDAPRVCCVSGTAGVGKTALAVRWAHQVSHRFPDGQLYLDLRGFGPDRPMDPAEGLEILLRAVRGDGFEPPPGLEARSGRFRSALAGLRVLLILDNAASAEQVRPLLPAGAGCLTIVTSRHVLPALVARDGARRLNVAPLPIAAATDVLRGLLGHRADAEPDSTVALAMRCAGLPLTLRVAAEVALSRPYTTLADLLAEEDSQDGWLDLLDNLDDGCTSVRHVFAWSYRCLDPDTARAFRLLGSQPGADIDEHAAAAMLGVEQAVARRHLRNLVGASLAAEPTHGRFGMHDLLRAYASELDADREAMRRLLDHYLTTAALAMGSILPADTQDFEIEPAIGPVAARLADPQQAMTWLHAERRNIVAAIVFADTNGYPEHAVRLAATTRRYLELHGYYLDVAQAHHHALDSARRLGDKRAEAIGHRDLGVVFGRANRNAEAEEHFRTAVALYRSVGDRAGETICIGNLGLLYLRTSRAAEAETYLRQAVDQALELDLPLCAASDLTALGTLETYLGRYEDAIEHHARAIAGFMVVGFLQAASAAQDGLGEAYLRLGRYDDAQVCLDAALAGAKCGGDRYGEAAALNTLGELYRLTDRLDEALDCFQRAIDVAVDIGDDRCQAGGHNGVARVMISRGLAVEASAHLERALAAAVRAEDSQQRVRALIGMALAAGHDLDAARQALDEARAACTALETLETREIERLSARLEEGRRVERP